MQIGARRSPSRTVDGAPGLPINHVVIVDFGAFQTLIDAVGGIDINVPEPILSNPFDCPYPTSRAACSGRAGDSARACSTWTASAR